MRKGKVKVYELNHKGEYELKQKVVNLAQYASNDRINYLSNNLFVEDDGLPKDINETLFTNPFLFQRDDYNKKYIISIEDFYVRYKKESFVFGSVVRTKNFTRREKRKIFHKNVKEWNKDAKLRIKTVFKDSENSINVASKNNYISVGFGNKFLLLVSLIIPILLFFEIKPYLVYDQEVYKYVGVGVSVLALLGLILGLVNEGRYVKHKAYIRKSKKLHKKYLKEVTNELDKKSKKLKKYYSRSLRRRNMKKSPLPIEKIIIGGEKIDYIEKTSNDISKKCIEIMRQNEGFNVYYHIPLFLSYLTALISCGYTIYKIGLYLFQVVLEKGE